jgi:hypothetical protein
MVMVVDMGRFWHTSNVPVLPDDAPDQSTGAFF